MRCLRKVRSKMNYPNNYRFKKVFGFNIFDQPFSDLIKDALAGSEKIIVNTISPNSYGIAKYDTEFKQALIESYVMLDGVYFGLASFLTGGGSIHANQGPHITKDALHFAQLNSLRVFFLGSTEETLLKIHSRLSKRYPNILFSSYSPPFSDSFDSFVELDIQNTINNFSPDILFIGMTCPKQEKWIFRNSDKIKFKISLSIGGVFDWLAGNRNEIPQLWWDLKLGWLYRIIQRPEIIRRNFKNTLVFFTDLVKHVIRYGKI